MLERRQGVPTVVRSKAMDICLSHSVHSDDSMSIAIEATQAAKSLIMWTNERNATAHSERFILRVGTHGKTPMAFLSNMRGLSTEK